MGIEDCDYERYEEMFLRSREKHRYISKTADSWMETKHPWSRNLILRHLTGERTIGLFPAHQVDYLMFDIDRHREKDETSLIPRMDAVMGVMDGDPLVYQSSFSGGIRLCFFLPGLADRKGLCHGFKTLFQERNVTVKPGFVEILAGRKGDRLPFGEGSYLVDPFTLEPIYHLTLKETISEAYNIFQHGKIDIPFDLQSPSLTPVFGPQGSGIFDQIVIPLYEKGLHPDISTNDALLKLSWHLVVRRGCSKEEAERLLINWIQQKHNRCSKRVNSGKLEYVFDQIRRIVKGVDPNRARYPVCRYAVREKKLSLSDVGKIISLTDDPKLQLGLFSLLEYCLNFGKNLHKERSKKNNIGNKQYVSDREGVTYRSLFQKNFYCEISKKTLQRLPGFGKANPQIAMRRIEELGIVSLKRRAHPQSHHCRHYWIHFAFDEEDSLKVVSLDEGLAKLNMVDRIKVFSS